MGWTRVVLAVVAGIWLVGCGDGDGTAEDQTRAEEAAGPAEESLYSVADPCGGLGDGEAAALLDIPVGELEKKVLGEMMDNACSLRSSTRPLGKSATFVLQAEPSVAAAVAGLDGQRQNFAVVVAAEPIDGLGDEAVWFGSKDPVVLNRLLVRKGNVWLDVVTAPDGVEGARKVAAAVLGQLQ